MSAQIMESKCPRDVLNSSDVLGQKAMSCLSTGLKLAVTAVEQGYAVPTGNVCHFEKVPGLTVLPLL
jgi:hypothetical protein